MNDISEARPQFFEGEYLGADDLQQLVVYLRDQNARHALGGHTWGIAAGLDLVEQSAPAGGTDVYMLPGYAVDGYGRAVIVINPLRLTVDLFAGQPSGPVPVWLRYDDGGTKGVRPGFEVCANGDAYARIAESYQVRAGYFASFAERQTGITVAGVTRDDPREAARTFDDNGPIVCDASVPYQELPLAEEKDKRWWIPLGLVGWTSGVPGQLRVLTDDERLLSRRQRRYLGVVAESVLAANGVIRLRRRETPWNSAPGTTTDTLCAPDDLADASHGNDLKVCEHGPAFNELVWIEGRVRITDDARLFGGRLEFRDAAGTDYLPAGQAGSAPLLLERVDRGTNADLRLLIGTAKSGSNRLVVAQAGDPKADPNDPCAATRFDTPTPRVVLQDDGKVGIGSQAPDQLLTVEAAEQAYVHVRASGGPHELYAGADESAATVAVINTDDLHVRAGGADPADDTFTRVAVTHSGRIGIGTTTPDLKRLVTLETESETYLIARTTKEPSREVLIGADNGGAIVSAMTQNTDLQLRGGGNSTAVWIKDSQRVGIGTSAPAERLDVRGNIALGSSGDLLAPGALDNLRIIAGAVNSNGTVSAGKGFTVSHPDTGEYSISFDSSFAHPPVVLANCTDAGQDNAAMVDNVSASGFDISLVDLMDNGDQPISEDGDFSFVVFGLRS